MNSISIALCTYNGARYLGEQLRTLCAQRGVGEIVVVDDGSTDGTWTILEDYARQDSRISLYGNAVPLGVTRNFERAISLVRGTWVALADQDDIWLPEKLARMCTAWDGQSCLIHHATHKFQGSVPANLPSPAGEVRKFFGSDVRRLLYRNTVVGHTVLVRTEVVRQLMPFFAAVPHDWWIGVGAAMLGRVQYVDEYLVHCRIHATNAYHAAGSRLQRLRMEHDLRVRLLQELVQQPALSDAQRTFIREYLNLLQNAAGRGFSRRLWRFYARHAAILFTGADPKLSWVTRLRKSVTATIGAMERRRGKSGHGAKAAVPRYANGHGKV